MSAMHSLHSTYTHIHKSTQHETPISYTATKLAAVPYIAIINKTGWETCVKEKFSIKREVRQTFSDTEKQINK